MITVNHLSMHFGGLKALDNISFEVRPQELFSIIGPNGSGKSTLFNVITGVYRPMAGQVRLDGDPITARSPMHVSLAGLARTFQNPKLFTDLTVLQNVLIPILARSKTTLFGEVISRKRYRALFAEAEPPAMDALEMVGLAAVAGGRADGLSYGDQKRLEMARALACKPKILLLDEPVAGLNAEEREKIRQLIVNLNKRDLPIMLIEHDMHMVMGISDRVMVLNYGNTIAMGSPNEVANDEAVISAYLGEEHVL